MDTSYNWNVVSNTIQWNKPNMIGTPALTSYNLYRNNELIASVNPFIDASNAYKPFVSYVDNNNLVGGIQYLYKVESISATTIGDVEPFFNTTSVVALNKPSKINANITGGNNQLAFDLSYNLNGLSNISYDISYNDASMVSVNLTNKPYNYIEMNLINGKNYYTQVRAKGTKTISGATYPNVVVYSEWTAIDEEMPVPPLNTPTALAVNNVDPSGIPLNGKLNLSWTNSSVPAYLPNPEIRIFRKLFSSPDPSFSFVASVSLPNNSYVDSDVVNGVNYSYRIFTRAINPNDNSFIDSNPTAIVSSIPFTYPSEVRNLTFADASMAYTFSPPVSEGGLFVQGYKFYLTNVSDSSSNPVNGVADLTANIRDASNNLKNMAGDLYNNTLNGAQYSLQVAAFVTNNSVQVIGPKSNLMYGFAQASTPAKPTLRNIDASSNPLDSKLMLEWVLPSNHDSTNLLVDIFVANSPAPLVQNINASLLKYMITGLLNGASYSYQIRFKLGSTISSLSVASDPSVPFSIPDAVLNLAANVTSPTTAALSWNSPSLVGKGLSSTNLRYQILNSNDNIVHNDVNALSQNLTNITTGQNVTYKVKIGVTGVIGQPAGVIYYNNVSSVSFATYGTPGLPQGLNVVPSANALLVDCNDAAVVAGLNFSGYDYKVSTVANPNNIVFSSTNSSSLFYVNNLTNNVNYNVQLRLKYLTNDAIPLEIYGSYASANATPQLAPPQPQNFSVTYDTGAAIKLSWSFDTTNQTTNYSMYKNGEIIMSNVAAQNGGVLSFNSQTNKWEFNTTGVAGVTDQYSLVALFSVGGNSYVSSQAAILSVTPYANPGPVQSLSYTPNDKVINLSWNVPTNTAGAGLNGNGPIQYKVSIQNPLLAGNLGVAVLGTTSNTSFLINGTTPIVDGSGNTFYLQNLQSYTISVISQFEVATGGLAVSSVNQIVAQARPLPKPFVLTATALDKNANGRSVRLNLQLDPSDALVSSARLRRVIKDVNGSTLHTMDYQSLNLTSGANNSYTYDDNGALGTQSSNFLNGNVMEYIVEVTMNSYTPSYNHVQNSNSINIVPSGRALLGNNGTGASLYDNNLFSIDASGNVKLFINKNGANVNSLTVIGFGRDGTSVVVNQPLVNNMNFVNLQVANKIAANQVAEVNISQQTLGVQINKALAIFANGNSTVLADCPNNSIL
jgi:hypothetical protein